ncbi:sterol desaturase family protein [Erythrobacter sp. NFXS35]|uniref:sterol desaturase family protein n=1 Tax=Erythrobacter sp. NFXS35 TaxID=2818436 RepID=UPI0032DF12DC
MLESFLQAAIATFKGLIIVAPFFVLLALVLKRRRALEGLKRARPEIVTNLGLLLVNGMVVVPLVAVPLAAFRDVIPRVPALIEFWTGLPAAVALIAAIMLIDLAAYWRHRFEHGPELWRFHATHHADEQMNWLTLRRKHPLGEFLSLLIDLIPVLLLGLPIWAIAGAALVRTGWGYFIHADVPWTLGAFGQIMISPAAHRLHHIRDETLMGANYGNTITLWDRLFGTYTDPAPYLNCETGIVEGTRDVAGELLRPFEARYRRAKARTVNETPAL